MRQLPIGLHTSRHLFQAQSFHAPSPSYVIRSLRRWFQHATDRAIGARVNDCQLNPFFFVIESGR